MASLHQQLTSSCRAARSVVALPSFVARRDCAMVAAPRSSLVAEGAPHMRDVSALAKGRGNNGPASAAATTSVRAPKKKSKKLVDINGNVDKDLGNGMFKIKLENGVTVMAHLSGKIRQNRIKIVMGDMVTVELSPYDLTKGRITYRFRPGEYDRLQAEAAAAAAAAAAGTDA